MLIVDSFATFFRVLVIAVGLLAVFCSTEYLKRERSPGGEFYALILFSLVGQSIMAASNELIMIFIGLEISSIASYILAGYLRDDARNNESALKYFLLGSFATAFLLYGIAWIYGITGSTNLIEIRRALLSGGAPSVALTGTAAALMFVGFGFKISAAPFQIWAPDVYQGAPAPVSAFLSVGPKPRRCDPDPRVHHRLRPDRRTMGAAGVGLRARDDDRRQLRRDSTIEHQAPARLQFDRPCRICSGCRNGEFRDRFRAAMFYLAAYAFTNFGAFAVVTYVARKGEKHTRIEDFAGLAQRQPMMAAMLTIFLLSLIGVRSPEAFSGSSTSSKPRWIRTWSGSPCSAF